MSKYNSLGGLFTAIANAIRAKTGGTDPIVAEDFPAAVEGISAGGGSGGDLSALGVSKMAAGTITMASNALALTINHELGVIPKIIFVYTKDHGVVLSYSDRTISSVFGVVFEDTDGDKRVIRQVTGKGNKSWTDLSSMYSGIVQGDFTSATITAGEIGGFGDVTESQIQCRYTNGAGYGSYFVAGATYEWFALA